MEAKYLTAQYRILDNVENFTDAAKKRCVYMGIDSWIYDVPNKRLIISSGDEKILNSAEEYIRNKFSLHEAMKRY